MAGTAFYSGLNDSGGLNALMRSLAGNQATQLGYQQGIAAEKGLADAMKSRYEVQSGERDYGNQMAGTFAHLGGKHGMDPATVKNYWDRISAGQGLQDITRSNTPEQNTKLQSLLTDLGALVQKDPTKVSGFHKGYAEVGGEQVKSDAMRMALDAAMRGDTETQHRFSSVAANHVPAEGAAPSDIRVFQWLQTQPEAVRRNYIATHKSLQNPGVQVNMPGATHYGTDPKTGQAGMFQIGKDGQTIFTPINPAPPTDPVKAAIAKAMSGQGAGQAPAQMPAPVPAAGGQRPRFDLWLPAAKKANPGASDADLKAYYMKKYGG